MNEGLSMEAIIAYLTTNKEARRQLAEALEEFLPFESTD